MLTRYTVKPFTIIMNRPRLNTIAGKDNITRIGLKKILIRVSNKPAIILPDTLFCIVTLLPSRPAAINKPNEQTSHLVIKFEVFDFTP